MEGKALESEDCDLRAKALDLPKPPRQNPECMRPNTANEMLFFK